MLAAALTVVTGAALHAAASCVLSSTALFLHARSRSRCLHFLRPACLAARFAKKIQPEHDSRLTFDALMLGSTCNETTRPLQAPPRAAPSRPQGGCSIYVAIDGDDSHAGTSAGTAKKTVAAGVAATRGVSGAKTLCIGNGTFYLAATIALTPADSHLSIVGSGGTWLSGAKDIPPLEWEQYVVCAPLPPLPLSLSLSSSGLVPGAAAARRLLPPPVPHSCVCTAEP